MGAVVERLVGGEVVEVVEVVVVVVVVVEGAGAGAGAVVDMVVVIARVESESERSCPGMEKEMQTTDDRRQTTDRDRDI